MKKILINLLMNFFNFIKKVSFNLKNQNKIYYIFIIITFTFSTQKI